MDRNLEYFEVEQRARQEIERQQFYARTAEIIFRRNIIPNMDLLESLPRTREGLEAEIRRIGDPKHFKRVQRIRGTERYGKRIIEILKAIRRENTGKIKRQNLNAKMRITPKIKHLINKLVTDMRNDPAYDEETLKNDVESIRSFKRDYTVWEFLDIERRNLDELTRDAEERAKIPSEQLRKELYRVGPYRNALKALDENHKTELTPVQLRNLYLEIEQIS